MREVDIFCDLCGKQAVNERIETYPSWFEIQTPSFGIKTISIKGCLRDGLCIEVCQPCFRILQDGMRKTVEEYVRPDRLPYDGSFKDK